MLPRVLFPRFGFGDWIGSPTCACLPIMPLLSFSSGSKFLSFFSRHVREGSNHDHDFSNSSWMRYARS